MKTNKHTTTLNASELTEFFRELSMLFESGITLSQAVFIMSENSANSKSAAVYSEICSMLDDGMTLSESMSACGRFPAHACSIVEIGQQSGKFEAVFSGLASYYERCDSLRRSIKNVLTYPLVMLTVMFCVLAVMIIKVLPMFSAVFVTTGAHMPAFLQLLTGSRLFSWGIIALMFMIIMIIAAIFIHTGNLLTSGENDNSLIASLPVIRNIFAKTDSGNFAYSMALLLSGGISIESALEMSLDMTSNTHLKAKLMDIQKNLDSGMTLSESIAVTGILEPSYTALLAAGEKSGRTDSTMEIIADKYTEQLQDKIGSVLAVIEPTLVIIMSLIIGFMLLSVMIPLMDIMTTL